MPWIGVLSLYQRQSIKYSNQMVTGLLRKESSCCTICPKVFEG